MKKAILAGLLLVGFAVAVATPSFQVAVKQTAAHADGDGGGGNDSGND